MKRKYWLIFILTLAAIAPGCKGKSVRPEDANAVVEQPGGPVGPTGVSASDVGPPLPPGGVPTSATGEVGPQPGPDFVPPQDGYVLVLGPGLARGLSYIGVLHELEAKAIPVRAIVAVEIGSVVAGIWASSNMNNLEWEMHKFNKGTVIDVPLLPLRSKVAEGKNLLRFLDQALKVNRLEKMKIPVVVVSAVKGDATGGMISESNGSARDIVRGAMSIPGILKTYSFEGKERFSAGIESPFPVAEAKKLGLGKTLCVDAVGSGDNFNPKEAVEEQLSVLMRSVSAIARQQLKECDAVLSVPTDGMSYLNFDAKADLIYQGRVAAQKWLGSLK